MNKNKFFLVAAAIVVATSITGCSLYPTDGSIRRTGDYIYGVTTGSVYSQHDRRIGGVDVGVAQENGKIRTGSVSVGGVAVDQDGGVFLPSPNIGW